MPRSSSRASSDSPLLTRAPVALALALGAFGCAAGAPSPAAQTVATAAGSAVAPGRRAAGPVVVRIDPVSGGDGAKAPGLAALEDELKRGMTELKAKGSPAPYYIAYEVHDRN